VPQGSSVTHETGHGLNGQVSIRPSCCLFPYQKIKGWKYKNRFEDNIKIVLYNEDRWIDFTWEGMEGKRMFL